MILQFFGYVLMMTTVIQACFITDCPRGMGKRSSLPGPALKPTSGPQWKYPQVRYLTIISVNVRDCVDVLKGKLI